MPAAATVTVAEAVMAAMANGASAAPRFSSLSNDRAASSGVLVNRAAHGFAINGDGIVGVVNRHAPVAKRGVELKRVDLHQRIAKARDTGALHLAAALADLEMLQNLIRPRLPSLADFLIAAGAAQRGRSRALQQRLKTVAPTARPARVFDPRKIIKQAFAIFTAMHFAAYSVALIMSLQMIHLSLIRFNS